MNKLLLAMMMGATLLLGGPQSDRNNLQLQSAINKEVVEGDLKGAIELYRKIAAQPGTGRATVATALLRMGQCYEKLGDTDTREARSAYEQLVRQYADQSEQAQAARSRLAVLAGTSSRTAGAEMTIRRVWSGPGSGRAGSESPSRDGRYLSMMDPDSGDLALWEAASGRMRRLTSKGNWSTSEMALDTTWSPDGKKIAYAWMTKDAGLELRIIGIDGSEPRILGPVWPLDWSPDGRSILAVVPKDGSKPERLALVSVADGSLTTLGSAEEPISSSSWDAGYSADGKFIVYDNRPKDGSPERDIFIYSIDGKQAFPLVKHSADDQLLGWVPGTNTVLFASNRTGTQDAWALTVADGKPQGEPTLVRKDIGQISPLGFADGGSFYYSLGVNVVDVFEGSLDLAKGIVAALPKKVPQRVVGANSSAEWSSDGKFLAYVSERLAGTASQSSYFLCLRSEQTGEEREIPLATGSFWRMHWAADGGAVFATMGDATNQGLFKIDIRTGKQTLLARSGWSDSLIKDFAVSPDGKSVYYVHFQWIKKLTPIIKYDLETGQEKEFYRNPGAGILDIGGMAVSPDGRYLSFSTADSLAEQRYVIRIVPTAGGEPRDLLLGKLETFARHAWAPDGKSILFVKRTASGTKDEKRELWQADTVGGEAKKINVGMEFRDLQLHPDGRRIVFTSGKPVREIWAMENFLPPAKAGK
ncbi:MAG: tetratricopeptide repeat protein [Candidatus Aminicenantes bacterium]|nr:tetratricopeptide repeat protein [Candidatus Aminicenantes bacterium]